MGRCDSLPSADLLLSDRKIILCQTADLLPVGLNAGMPAGLVLHSSARYDQLEAKRNSKKCYWKMFCYFSSPAVLFHPYCRIYMYPVLESRGLFDLNAATWWRSLVISFSHYVYIKFTLKSVFQCFLFWVKVVSFEQHVCSWNLGSAHFISFSTEVYFFPEYGMDLLFRQYEWLKNDLEVNVQSFQFIILG